MVSAVSDRNPPRIADALDAMAAHFKFAAAGENTLLNYTTALRYVIVALDMPDGGDTSEMQRKVVEISGPATEEAIKDAAPAIASDYIRLGVGFVIELVQMLHLRPADFVARLPRDDFLDRIDFIALVADDLDALHRRRSITARAAQVGAFLPPATPIAAKLTLH